jgi:hypothetical protein
MDKCILYFHQGWTDIANSFGILTYHAIKYKQIYLIIRNDAEDFIRFYLKKYSNITVFLMSNWNEYTVPIYTNYIKQTFNLTDNDFDKCYIGYYDMYRVDKYKDKMKNTEYNFVLSFYKLYDIPYNYRIELFNIDRDIDNEITIYKQFKNIHVKQLEYILYHDYSNLITNEIDIYIKDNKHIDYINLHGKSNIFFDYITIIQNAKELHLVDSIWAVLVYLLDSKYSLFNNTKIIIYCKRGYNFMFNDNNKLENWTII